VDDLNPEEELKKLDRLIHQYEIVSRTTSNKEQRARVEKQVLQLRSYRQKILDVNIIEPEVPRQTEAFADFKHLRRLLDAESHRPPLERLATLAGADVEPTAAQEEIFNLMIYLRFFQGEFLPFLTEKRLKLDYKFSLERDGFYGNYKELERALDQFRREDARISNGAVRREMEPDILKRIVTLKRRIKSETAGLFRTIHAFCEELMEDADGDMVKCLNGSEAIVFDDIEGRRLLSGMKVSNALAVLEGFAVELVAYLNVPDTDSG
jgi:hypothetical protein